MKKLIIGLLIIASQSISAQEVRYLIGKEFFTTEKSRLNAWEKSSDSHYRYNYGVLLNKEGFNNIKMEYVNILDFYGLTTDDVKKNESKFYSDNYDEDDDGVDRLDKEILSGLSKIKVVYSKIVNGKLVVLVFLTGETVATLTISEKKML